MFLKWWNSKGDTPSSDPFVRLFRFMLCALVANRTFLGIWEYIKGIRNSRNINGPYIQPVCAWESQVVKCGRCGDDLKVSVFAIRTTLNEIYFRIARKRVGLGESLLKNGRRLAAGRILAAVDAIFLSSTSPHMFTLSFFFRAGFWQNKQIYKWILLTD